MYQIGKISQWLRTYFLFDKEVENIIIYDKKDGVIFKTKQGWFENGTWEKDIYNCDVEYFNLPIDTVRRSIKVNFEKNDAFYVKNKDKIYKDINHVDLYIPSTMISVKDRGTNIYLEQKHQHYELTLLDENCKFAFWGKDNNTYSQSIMCHKFVEEVKSEKTLLLEKLLGDIKEKTGINISKYDIGQLLTHFDITPKSEK